MLNKTRQSMRGVSLCEVLICSAVIALLLSQAGPSYATLLDRYALRSAAAELHAYLNAARREALRLNRAVNVSVSANASTAAASGGGCVVASLEKDCSCGRAEQCALDNLAALQFDRSIRLNSGAVAQFSFAPPWGFSRTGTIALRSKLGKELRLVRSAFGRLRLCAPNPVAISGYAPC